MSDLERIDSASRGRDRYECSEVYASYVCTEGQKVQVRLTPCTVSFTEVRQACEPFPIIFQSSSSNAVNTI